MEELKVPCASKSLLSFIIILFCDMPSVRNNSYPDVKTSASYAHLCKFFDSNFGQCIPYAY